MTMGHVGVIAGALIVLLGAAPARAVSYAQQVAGANRVGLTVTNYGVLGNNFVNRTPSGEYPLGTGYEHLVNAGLWVGARATDGLGSFTGVTTAMLEISQGIAPASVTEFTPSGDGLLRRSAVHGSPDYDPTAVSALDLIALFDDATLKPALPYGAHRPLNLAVRQASYQWSQPGREDFVIERFVVRNAGASPLTDVHVGMYSLLASGPKNAYSTWPPSSIGSIYGSWYGKQLLAWDGPQRLLREHRCSGQPIPEGCQFEITPAWLGVQLLTPPAPGQQITVAAWNYSPGDTARNEDVERYEILSAGTIADVTDWTLLPGHGGDPVEVLALGPFPTLAPGDSIEVAFAVVGGGDEAAILQNAAVAQQVRDSGYQNPLVAVGDPPGIGRLRLAPTVNPLSRGACSISLEIPGSALSASRSPRLEVFDASGRMVAGRDLGSLGPGRHTVRLDEVATAAPGVYFLRLTSGADVVGSRIVVLP